MRYPLLLLSLFLSLWVLGACAPDPGSAPNDGGSAAPDPPHIAGVVRFGAARGYTFATAVASDGQGGALVALDTDVSLDGELRGERDLALARVDAEGRTRWTRQLGAPGFFTRAFALAVDADGNVYAAGLANGRGAFEGETVPSILTALVVSFSAEGTRRWTRLLGAPGGVTEAMALGLSGGALQVLGYTTASLAGSPALGRGDVFVATLAPETGVPRQVQLLGGPEEDLPLGLAPAGGGLWLGMHSTQGPHGAPLGTRLLHLGPDGRLTERFSLPPSPAGSPSLLAAAGDVFILTDTGQDHALLRRYTPDGALREEQPTPQADGLRVQALACGASGIALAGRVRGPLDGTVASGRTDGWLGWFGGRWPAPTATPALLRWGSEASEAATNVAAIAETADGWLVAGAVGGPLLGTQPLGAIDGVLLRIARPRR